MQTKKKKVNFNQNLQFNNKLIFSSHFYKLKRLLNNFHFLFIFQFTSLHSQQRTKPNFGFIYLFNFFRSIIKERLEFPRNLIYGQCVATFLLHIAFLMGFFSGSHEKVWCTSNIEVAKQNYPLCGVQGLFIHIFKLFF